MKVTTKTRLQYRIQNSFFTLLLISCIALAGWLSVEYNVRSDWTAGKRHSLSQDTLELLKELPDEIQLRSYQPEEPALIQAITETLSRYQRHKTNFHFKLINPDIFIQQAKTDNIAHYGQTVIEYQGRQARIEKISEENIGNALIRLHRNAKTRLLFITQHGERNIKDASDTGYSQLTKRLTDKGFETRQINLLQDTITPDGTVLVLGSVNKPLLDSEQEKILNYINEGGNLLWLQDPGVDSTLKAIADALQIEFLNGVVVDNNQEISRMLKLGHPAIIAILEYKRHPITEKMQYFTLFTSALAIQANVPESARESTSDSGSDSANDSGRDTRAAPAKHKWISTNLLITSDSSWTETGDLLIGVKFTPKEDTAGPLSIGIAQQRQIKSADSRSAQRVVVIGDTDFIANNQLGQGANLDFILKTLNWLAKDDKLISIAPKNAPDLQLKLSAATASIIGIAFLILMPLLLTACGIIIWRKRHRQ